MSEARPAVSRLAQVCSWQEPGLGAVEDGGVHTLPWAER